MVPVTLWSPRMYRFVSNTHATHGGLPTVRVLYIMIPSVMDAILVRGRSALIMYMKAPRKLERCARNYMSDVEKFRY